MTDVKELIERLRAIAGFDVARFHGATILNEAADALEATVNELNGRDHDIVILEAELAEEKRKREEAERRVERLRDELWDSAQWKRKCEAAREVGSKYLAFYVVNKRGAYIPTLQEIESAKGQFDAEVDAKMKEQNPA